MTAFRRPESVLVVIHTIDKQFLLMQRADLPEFWQSVSGTLEAGESAPGCARREVVEETGLRDLDILDHARSNRYRIKPHWQPRYKPGTEFNTEHVFSVELPSIVEISLNPAEHLAHRWLEPAAALALCSSATNRAEIERIAAA